MSSSQSLGPLPPPGPFDLPTCNPQPLPALELPPDITPPPLSLPRQRKSLLDPWYTLSTHAVPAAFPRIVPDVPVPHVPSERGASKDAYEQAAHDIIDLKARQWRGELSDLPPSRKPLWVCVNRYTRRGLPEWGTGGGVTLFVAHGIGFHKEVSTTCPLERSTGTGS